MRQVFIIPTLFFLQIHSGFSQDLNDTVPEKQKLSYPNNNYSQKPDSEMWEEKLKLSYLYENYYQNLDSAISSIINIPLKGDTACFRNFRVGTLFYLIGDYKMAKKHFLQTYPCMANSIIVPHYILACEMKTNLFSIAEETATEIYRWQDSLNYTATITLAWLSIVDLDFYQAKEFIERYLRYYPSDVIANRYYSECLLAQGKRKSYQTQLNKLALLSPDRNEQKTDSIQAESLYIPDISLSPRINGYASYILDESNLQGPSLTAEIYNYHFADYFSVMNMGFNSENRREGFRNAFGYFFNSGYSVTSNQGYFFSTEKFYGTGVKKEFYFFDLGFGTYNTFWNYNINALIFNEKNLSGIKQEQFSVSSQFFKNRRVELKLYYSIIHDAIIKKTGSVSEMVLHFRITPYTAFEFQYFKGNILYPYSFADGGVLILTPQIMESGYAIKIEQNLDARWQIFGKYSKSTVGTTSGTGIYGGIRYRLKKF